MDGRTPQAGWGGWGPDIEALQVVDMSLVDRAAAAEKYLVPKPLNLILSSWGPRSRVRVWGSENVFEGWSTCAWSIERPYTNPKPTPHPPRSLHRSGAVGGLHVVDKCELVLWGLQNMGPLCHFRGPWPSSS